MKAILIAGLMAGTAYLCAGCSSSPVASSNANAKTNDPEAYLNPNNSRVPFILTDTYTMPLGEGLGHELVNDVDARDNAVEAHQNKRQ